MRISFAPAAEKDVEEIGDYIHADNPAAAYRFVRSLRVRCGELGDAPLAGRSRQELLPGLRSIAFRRYVIFYTASAGDVRIERILHGARDLPTLFPEGRK